jgi:hypothetical protein
VSPHRAARHHRGASTYASSSAHRHYVAQLDYRRHGSFADPARSSNSLLHADPTTTTTAQFRSSVSSFDTNTTSVATSSSSNSNIDPRYGVDKRLVPTGPNPLHN